MLIHLFIENFALIEKLDLQFNNGFTVITGETGAGKSVFLGALALVLGKRADTQDILNLNNKCIIEATFNIHNYQLNTFFKENDLDYDDNLIIRREITPNGKSRAFINDTPVSLNVLRILAEKLVDIHSQNKTITLNDVDIQLSVVDAYALHDDLLKQYRENFIKFKTLKTTLSQLENTNLKAKSEIDYIQFLYNELLKANLNDTEEQTKLENELAFLAHANDAKFTLEKILYELDESDENIIYKISSLISSLKNFANYHIGISSVLNRLDNIYIELKDITSDTNKILSNISSDPDKLNLLNERLELIYKLEKKHNVNTIKELINIMNNLKEKIEKINLYDEEISKLKTELQDLWEIIAQKAQEIHTNRHKVIPKIEQEVTLILNQLAIPNACFKIQHNTTNEYNINGKDEIQFLFSANKGIAPGEIAKIASGGELSRLMLAIKSIVAERKLIPTLFFDEIDVGVSGNVARKVGNIMKTMSENMQLIVITHLPQIASLANNHLKVYKTVSEKGNTITNIVYLNKDERVTEIARLLSGEKITNAAITTAKELLNF